MDSSARNSLNNPDSKKGFGANLRARTKALFDMDASFPVFGLGHGAGAPPFQAQAAPHRVNRPSRLSSGTTLLQPSVDYRQYFPTQPYQYHRLPGRNGYDGRGSTQRRNQNAWSNDGIISTYWKSAEFSTHQRPVSRDNQFHGGQNRSSLKYSGHLNNPRTETQRGHGRKQIQSTASYRDRDSQGGAKKARNYFSALSVCNNSDYNSDSEWLEMSLSHPSRTSHSDKLYISVTEPVMSNQTPCREWMPHYHISKPFYSDPNQVGRCMVSVRIPEEISRIKTSFDFSVLSYNVLADKLLKDNYRLYQGYPDWVLDWEYRKNNLLKEIITYNADVICLQEVQKDHMNEVFLPVLNKNGYIGCYKQRTGGKPDGCAIFYRESRFNYLDCRMSEFRKQRHQIMNRDNVAVIVALQPKDTPNKPPIFIANTHLLFNKNRGDIKLLQLATLLAEVDEMAKVFSHLPSKSTAEDVYNPVIICGDFNSAPFSPVYDFLVNGQLKYAGKSRVHLSGQNSPQKVPVQSSFLDSTLIPDDLRLTDLCQKRERDIQDSSTESREPNMVNENSDCLIIGEKVDGKNVVLEEPGVLKHLLNLQSVYKHVLKDGHQEVSTCHLEGCLCVDYIFFSQGKQGTISKCVNEGDDIFIEMPRRQLYLTGLLSLLGSDEVVAMGRLPNICLSSDHLALYACFKLIE